MLTIQNANFTGNRNNMRFGCLRPLTELEKLKAGEVYEELPKYFPNLFNPRNKPTDGIMSAIALGVIKAVETYNQEEGKFLPYLERKIKWAIQDHLREISHKRGGRKIKLAVDKFIAVNGREPTFAEMETDLKLKRRAIDNFFTEKLSVDQDTLPNDTTPIWATIQSKDDSIKNKEWENTIFKLLGHIKEQKHREMICYSYGILGFEKTTMKKIGEEYGVSESRVSQVIKEGEETLRRAAKGMGLKISDFQ